MVFGVGFEPTQTTLLLIARCSLTFKLPEHIKPRTNKRLEILQQEGEIMKFVRILLAVFEVALFAIPDLYYRSAFETGNFAIIITFFALNIAFIKSLDYFVKLAKNLGKPTR